MPTYQELVAQASAAGVPYSDLQNLGNGEAFQQALAQRINGASSSGPQWDTVDPAYAGRNNGSTAYPYAGYDTAPVGAAPAAQNGVQLPMNVVTLSNNMQDALKRGDDQGYLQALNAYKAATDGQQPPWSFGITPDQVRMNATNPGGVSYGQTNPQNTPPTPSPNGGPVPFTYGGAPPPMNGQSGPGGRVNDTTLGPGGPTAPPRGGQQSIPAGGPTTGRVPLRTGQPGVATRATPNASAVPGRQNQSPTGQRGIRPLPGGGVLGADTPIPGPPLRTSRQPGEIPPPPRVPPSTPGLGPDEPPPAPNGPPLRPAPPAPGDPNGPPRVSPPPGRSPGTPITPPPYTPPSPYTPPPPFTPYAPPSGQATPPQPNPAYTSSAFPNWSTWNGGNPYMEGDPGMMATSEANRAVDYGNLFQNEFGQSYADANAASGAYGRAADTAYNDLYQNPGFTGSEADLIQNGGIDGGLNTLRATQSQLDENYLTPEEQASIRGNPNASREAFDPNTLNDIARTGTTATQGFFGRNYQTAQDALAAGAGRTDAAFGTYGANARGDYGTMASTLQGAIDPNKLGISDAEVERLKEQAGRQVGAQYGSAIDELQRKAEAAGNVSPLALSAARDRLLRSQAVDSATAVNAADLAAREKQRQAEQDISSRRIGVGTTLGQTGIGMEGDIASTGLNANQNQTALNTGTQATYGTMGTNLGLNTTNQLTNTANTAGQTAIQQAQYGDTNSANRAAALGTNRQAVTTGNLGTRFNQGMGTAAANTANTTTLGNARIAGQQAARNYWQGQNQFQGGQANTAGNQQLSGAQTSLSGQGQGGSTAVGNLNARRNPIQIGGIGFTL